MSKWNRIAALALAVAAPASAVTVTPTLVPLASFNGTNGQAPQFAPTVDSAGNLFGTTLGGGAAGQGTVFELPAGSSTINALAPFNNSSSGNIASGAVVLDSAGNLFTTASGRGYGTGAYVDGALVELPTGGNSLVVLNAFNSAGDAPIGLISNGKGTLFGTLAFGGTNNAGGVFAYNSTAGVTVAKMATGQMPISNPVLDSGGNLFGGTQSGGAAGAGVIFEWPAGSSSVVDRYSFATAVGGAVGTIAVDSKGDLFGDSPYSGDLWELPAGSTTLHILASGVSDSSGVLIDGAGDLFGVASGGTYTDGRVFELPAGSGTVLTLVSFNGSNGSGPVGLTADAAGDLFGATASGGANQDGALFEVTNSGFVPIPVPEPTTLALPLLLAHLVRRRRAARRLTATRIG